MVTVKGDVTEQDAPYRTAVPRDDANAAVGIKYAAAGHGNIFDVIPGFRADFNRAAVAAQQAVADRDAPGRTAQTARLQGCFNANRIVSGAEVAVANQHGLAAVDIQRVRVGQRHGVINGQMVNVYMAAADKVHRPHGA